MEFDELLVTTGVDSLVRIVKERQRIELEEASLLLGTPAETLEEWARILEEEGILRIDYRLTKLFLVWVKPTEDEIASEVKSFNEEKSAIEGELGQVSMGIVSGKTETKQIEESFAEFYSKAIKKLEQLEKAVATVPAGKLLNEDKFTQGEEEVTGLRTQLEEIRNNITQLKDEIKGSGIAPNKGEKEELIKTVETSQAELAEIQKDLVALKKKASTQTAAETSAEVPTANEIKKKFESLKKEFSEIKSRNLSLTEDIRDLQEAKKVMSEVGGALLDNEAKVKEIRDELSGLNEQARTLKETVDRVVDRASESLDALARFEDSANFAKGAAKLVPDEEKVVKEVETLQEKEDKISEKLEALEQLLEMIGGKQVGAKKYVDLTESLDDKIRQVRIELDSLAASLDDEKATYLAFQKINDRVVGSIDSYNKQLGAIEDRINKVEKETIERKELLEKEAEKLKETLGASGFKEAIDLARSIETKKAELENLRNTMSDVSNLSESLDKRIILLSNEAKLLEIRSSGSEMGSSGTGGGTSGTGSGTSGIGTGRVGGVKTEAEIQKEKEIRQQVELTKDEELEFRRKREELKSLIKKLWQEEK